MKIDENMNMKKIKKNTWKRSDSTYLFLMCGHIRSNLSSLLSRLGLLSMIETAEATERAPGSDSSKKRRTTAAAAATGADKRSSPAPGQLSLFR
jgi:hypothetical protein